MSFRHFSAIVGSVAAIGAAALLAPTGATAQTALPAFAAPTGFGIKAPLGNGLPLYGFTGARNNWTVTQWFKPVPLPDFAPVADATTPFPTYQTHTVNDSVTVVLNGTPTVTLSESGLGLPCTTANGDAQEYDLFFGGTSLHTAPEYSAFLADTTPSAAGNLILSNMRALMERGTYQVIAMWSPSATTTCKVNQASSLISVTLHNSVANPQQTLFYHVPITQSCPLGSAPTCTRSGKPYFYNEGTPGTGGIHFGYKDSLTMYGQTLVENTAPTTFNLDLLPQIKKVIAAGAAYGMDTDISHWSISGMYNGQHVWGNAGLSTFWSGFVPTPVPLAAPQG